MVAGITPWNYPLYQLAAKVGPALAAGCTIVVKPSSVAPLATFVLAQIAHDSGAPARRAQPPLRPWGRRRRDCWPAIPTSTW